MLGLWPTSSAACEEYGAECTWREIWWCMCRFKGTVWPGLFPHWHYHDPFPNYKELWYGRICKAGVLEGLPILVVKTFLFISNLLFSTIYSFLPWWQETGFAHMRICDGVGSYLQMCGLLAKLSLVRETAKAAWWDRHCSSWSNCDESSMVFHFLSRTPSFSCK